MTMNSIRENITFDLWVSKRRRVKIVLIVTLCNEKLGVAVNVKDIDRAHHIRTENAGKPRAIIVKFKDYNSKMAVCKQRKDLKGSKFYINEDLTKINIKLFYVGRNNVSQIKSIWPSDGKLLARGEDDKIVRIRSAKDFEYFN
jgi:hypothetical protein